MRQRLWRAMPSRTPRMGKGSFWVPSRSFASFFVQRTLTEQRAAERLRPDGLLGVGAVAQTGFWRDLLVTTEVEVDWRRVLYVEATDPYGSLGQRLGWDRELWKQRAAKRMSAELLRSVDRLDYLVGLLVQGGYLVGGYDWCGAVGLACHAPPPARPEDDPYAGPLDQIMVRVSSEPLEILESPLCRECRQQQYQALKRWHERHVVWEANGKAKGEAQPLMAAARSCEGDCEFARPRDAAWKTTAECPGGDVDLPLAAALMKLGFQ